MPISNSNRKMFDTRNVTRQEMLLIRAIHHIWYWRKKSRLTGVEFRASDEALETLFEAKRQVKAEIKAKNAESFKKWRAGA